MRKLRAFALVLPLLVFLIVTFVVPILDMLRLAVVDRDLAAVWPHVTQSINTWTDRSKVPPPAVLLVLTSRLSGS